MSVEWRPHLGAPAFLSGESKGGQDILGGKSMWLQIMHFHKTGHIPNAYFLPKFPSFFVFLIASCATFSFPSLFHSHLLLSPTFIQLGRSEERCKLPQPAQVEPGRRMQFWRILGLEMSVFYSNVGNYSVL